MFPTTLKTLQDVSETLAPAFGPCGRDVLIVTQGKQLLITNEGSRILECVATTPGPALIPLRSARAFGEATGDGTSTLVLMVCAGFAACAEQLHMHSTWSRIHRTQTRTNCRKLLNAASEGVFSQESSRCELVRLIRGVEAAGRWLIGVLRGVIAEQEVSVDDKSADEAVRMLLHTSFARKLGPRLNKAFVDLVIDLLGGNGGVLWFDFDGWKRFPRVVGAVGESACLSFCVEGMLVDQTFRGTLVPSELDCPVAVAFACSIKEEEESARDFQVARDKKESFRESERVQLRQKIAAIGDRGVSLIITTERASDLLVYLCRERGIFVLSGVCEDFLHQFCCANGVEPLTDTLWSTIAQGKLVELRICKRVQVGKRRYTQLCGKHDRCKTAVVMAPNDELLRMYRTKIKRAVRLVETSIVENYSSFGPKKRLSIVPGAGCVAIALAARIKEELDNIRIGHANGWDTPDRERASPSTLMIGLRVMLSMAEAVPKLLATATAPPARVFTLKMKDAEDRLRGGQECVGFVCCERSMCANDPYSLTVQQGCVENPLALGVVEPLQLHVWLWESGLSALVQVLRIDGVLSIKSKR